LATQSKASRYARREAGGWPAGVAAGETPVARTFASGALMVGNLGFKLLSQALLVPVSLHYLSAEEYGLWIVVQSLGFYLGLSEFGLGQTVMNRMGAAFARRQMAGTAALLSNAFALYHLIAVPFWLALIACWWGNHWSRWLAKSPSAGNSTHLGLYVMLFGTLTLLKVPWTTFPAALAGLRELPLRQLYELVASILLFLTVLVTFAFGGRVLALVLSTGGASVMLAAAAYPLVRSRYPEARIRLTLVDPRVMRGLLADSLSFFLISLAYVMQRYSPSVLAAKYTSLDVVPQVYAVVTLLRLVGWSLADIPSRSVQPYVIMLGEQGQERQVRALACLATKFSFAVAVVFAALVAVHANWFLNRWLAPLRFTEYGILAAMTAAFLLDALFLPATNVLVALNRHKRLALLLAVQGLAGAAVAVLLAEAGVLSPTARLGVGFLIASLIVNVGWIPRLLKVELGMPMRCLARCAGFAFLLWAALGALWLASPRLVPVGGSAVCLAGTWILGGRILLSQGERHQLASLVRSIRPVAPTLRSTSD